MPRAVVAAEEPASILHYSIDTTTTPHISFQDETEKSDVIRKQLQQLAKLKSKLLSTKQSTKRTTSTSNNLSSMSQSTPHCLHSYMLTNIVRNDRKLNEFNDLFERFTPGLELNYMDRIVDANLIEDIDVAAAAAPPPSYIATQFEQPPESQMFVDIIESRYQNQIPNSPAAPLQPLFGQTSTPSTSTFITPLKRQKTELNRSLSNKKQDKLKPIISPIKLAFQKSAEKLKKCVEQRESLEINAIEVLSYFRLTDVMDMFDSEPEDSVECAVETNCAQTSNKSSEFNKTRIENEIIPTNSAECNQTKLNAKLADKSIDEICDSQPIIISRVTKNPKSSVDTIRRRNKLQLQSFTDFLNSDDDEENITNSEIIPSSQDLIAPSLSRYASRQQATTFSSNSNASLLNAAFDESLGHLVAAKSTESSDAPLSSSLKENDEPITSGHNQPSSPLCTPRKPPDIVTKSPSVLKTRLNFSRLNGCRLNSSAPLSATRSEQHLQSTQASQIHTADVSTFNKPSICKCGRRYKIVIYIKHLFSLSDLDKFKFSLANQSQTVKSDGKRKRSPTKSSSSSSDADDFVGGTARRTPPQKLSRMKKKRRTKCAFVLDECAVSGSDGSADEFERATQSEMIQDSIVISDDDDVSDDPADMHAKYLQSIR